MLPPWTDAETAWLAGLFEGEGTVFLAGRTVSGKRVQPVACIGMTDLDIMERVGRLFDKEVFDHNNKASLGTKKAYRVTLSSRGDVAELHRRIEPYLGLRRRKQFQAVLPAEVQDLAL